MPRDSWRWTVALAVLFASACGDGVLPDPRDASRDRGPSVDGAVDSPSGLDAVGDSVTGLDIVAPPDVQAPPPCDRRFSVSPSPPGDDAPFIVSFTDTPGYTNIGLQFAGPSMPSWLFLDVTGTPHVWRFRVTGATAGRYVVRFVADPANTTIATCTMDVVARIGTMDSGTRDTGPVDTGSDTGPLTTPPMNRFGIGLVAPGNPTQLDLAANLSGPGGHVKLIFAGVRPGLTGPTPEWVNAVRDAYARDLVPVIRFAPDWGDRRVRNQADDATGRRYTNLASAYVAVVRGLPRRAGWPLYVEVHNEPNLCDEWACDAGAAPGGRIMLAQIAAEYASMLRDVAAAIRAIRDTNLRVINAGMSPGGVVWCQCVGPRAVVAGEWAGGVTSLDFLRAMIAAVPDAFANVDGFASHSYPASGRGFGFFPPYASAGVGLRYFNDELGAIGRTLPVFITETGWSINRDGGGSNSRDEIASWTQQAYRDVWLTDPNVRAVMPFELQDGAWDAFSWVRTDGTAYPVYTTVRAFRCTRIAGRCP